MESRLIKVACVCMLKLLSILYLQVQTYNHLLLHTTASTMAERGLSQSANIITFAGCLVIQLCRVSIPYLRFCKLTICTTPLAQPPLKSITCTSLELHYEPVGLTTLIYAFPNIYT